MWDDTHFHTFPQRKSYADSSNFDLLFNYPKKLDITQNTDTQKHEEQTQK